MSLAASPTTHPAPGQLLWGEAPRRQPIAPLILMSLLVLLVAAPTALGGSGGVSNPIVLMRQVADMTYELAGLIGESNGSLKSIDSSASRLAEVQSNMDAIVTSTTGMAAKTQQLQGKLVTVADAVEAADGKLTAVDGKLTKTASGVAGMRASVQRAGTSTDGVVREFRTIDRSIGSMDRGLRSTIVKMGASGALTKEFAGNRTRIAAIGDARKYGVPNLAPDNRVMSIVLPMIQVLQEGGKLPARKDRHVASNIVIDAALRLQVPDGVNVIAIVRPFDGQLYGLPGKDYFVNNRVHGF